jgi:hypothetical protein
MGYKNERMLKYFICKRLFVYNFAKKKIHQLKDEYPTHHYFEKFNPHYSKDCSGKVGKDVPIF